MSLFKYKIGILEGSVIKTVNYLSRSDFHTQAFLLDEQFPSLETVMSYLADFDHEEIQVESVRSLRKVVRTSDIDGVFIYIGEKSQWHIFNMQNVRFNNFIGIYEESPEFDHNQAHICSCEVRKDSKLKKAFSKLVTPDKIIYTQLGYERYCLHCHGYEPEVNYYISSENGKKAFDSVCKSCYIPHYKPYKMKASA